MNRPCPSKGLRIAVRAVSGVMCSALIVMWATSYWWRLAIWDWFPPNMVYVQATSVNGSVYLSHIASNTSPSGAWGGSIRTTVGSGTWSFRLQKIGDDYSNCTLTIPYWFAVLLSILPAALVAAPWRFSLRTILFVNTVIAVALGLAVWLTQ